ncbi:MAG: GNAT family N-acetyltransferase [Vallitaleaceae bacterium]|jgi:L-amino acid N-acyltransferase YncA|nr:GNAT family N-acetyltransferase [Vallitaleaceae bacterium]
MIRYAKQEDLKELLGIYNDAIINGTASFEEVSLTFEDGKEWLLSHQEDYPLLVYEKEERVLGYASLSPFGRARETAYAMTAELSIYIHSDARGLGLGRALITAIIDEGKKRGKFKNIISVITEGNEGSVILHNKMGFVYGGRLTDVAFKHNEQLSILFYQKTLVATKK